MSGKYEAVSVVAVVVNVVAVFLNVVVVAVVHG
jgi:hypothetical protein